MLFKQDCPLESGVGVIQWSMGKPLVVILLKIMICFPKNISAVNSSPGKSRAPWGFSPSMTECPEAQAYAGLVQAIVAPISLLLQGLHHVQMRAFDYLSHLTILMRKEGEKKKRREENRCYLCCCPWKNSLIARSQMKQVTEGRCHCLYACANHPNHTAVFRQC